ncbi:reverse transcriptase domain-containing protein [Tanacetum coccineum]
MFDQFMKTNTSFTSGSGLLPSNIVANPRGDLKAITTRSGISYDGLPSSSLPKVVEREPEVIKDTVLPSTENIQPLVVQIQAPINEHVVAPKPKPSIPYPSRANKQNLCEKDDNLASKFLVECLALADLGASINSMPLSIWKKLSLPELTPTQMILELAESIYYLSPSCCVLLKSSRCHRHTCEEYAQEVLGFSEISTKDFIACLQTDSIPPRIDDADFDPVGDLLLLEKLLNDDPSSPLPPKELHVEELKIVKSSIDDPPELELKDLPSHLEYAFLEGTDKLPIIIAKDLKEDEKVRLLKVLKSHKRAIAWKISDIKGIDPQFCTHKILMEDDSKPAIQHQRRVNPKIHEVIKKEVIKLLGSGLIYPISDSLWETMECLHGDPHLRDSFSSLPHPFRQNAKTVAKILFVSNWEKNAIFNECIESFNILKKKLTEAPILVAPDWDLPFEIMCDASDYAVGAVLKQRKTKHFQPIHYASKTMTDAQADYTTTEKELLAVVYAFEKLWPYLVLSKTIVYTDHSALKYLLAKQDAKPRLLRIAPDYEATRARGFVLRSLELQSLA